MVGGISSVRTDTPRVFSERPQYKMRPEESLGVRSFTMAIKRVTVEIAGSGFMEPIADAAVGTETLSINDS